MERATRNSGWVLVNSVRKLCGFGRKVSGRVADHTGVLGTELIVSYGKELISPSHDRRSSEPHDLFTSLESKKNHMPVNLFVD
jgi:hypothetical protein